MEKLYEIVVNIRVPNGFAEVARYFISDDKEEAYALFNRLDGVLVNEDATAAIRFELVERSKPINNLLSTIYCSLCEAGDNSEVIIKEVFKALNMG